MATVSTINIGNIASTFDQITEIVNEIFVTNTQTVGLLNSFNSTPSYVFADALRQTMHNLCDILDASMMLYGLNIAAVNLEEIEAISLPITVTDANYLSTRTTGIGNAINYLQTNIVGYVQPISTLAAGSPMVSTVPYLTYLSQLNAETPPTSATTAATIYPVSQDEAAAWLRIQAALNASGVSFSASISDTLLYLNEVQSAATAFASAYVPLSTSFPASALWNYTICLPIYQDLAGIYYNNPASTLLQAALTLRYSLKQAELTCAQLLIAYMDQLETNIDTATLIEGQSLMDFANKNTGDYTNWLAIALANGLLPPYTADVDDGNNPNVAVPGQNLFLPGAQPTGPVGNYTMNFLGSDLNFGIPQGSMPPWTGDFQTVNGYTNLRYALARRLLTAIGSFVYHPTYGSLTPLELGKPMAISNVAIVLAYVKSALLSDPRVASVLSLVATIQSDTTCNITASVEPSGGPSQSTTVNVVLQPGAVAQSGS